MKHLTIILSILLTQTANSQNLKDPKTWKDFSLQGKVKHVEENSIGSKKKADDTYNYTFNEDGNLTYKSEQYGKRINEAHYSYNPDKKVEKITYINKEEEKEILNSQASLRYQNDSVFVKAIIKDENEIGEKSFVMIMKNGLMKKYYEKQGENLEEYILEYDNHQNLITETKYINGELDDKREYQYAYDKNGNLTSKTLFKGSIVTLYPNGLRKSWGSYTYKYEYDSAGNWIHQTVYENGKKYQESKREITYFDEN